MLDIFKQILQKYQIFVRFTADSQVRMGTNQLYVDQNIAKCFFLYSSFLLLNINSNGIFWDSNFWSKIEPEYRVTLNLDKIAMHLK